MPLRASSSPLLPLVGRDAELAMLAAALDDADAGQGAAIFVVGEGGIGKTRLVTALLEQAERRGWTTALGRAYPVETGVPYAPFSDALVPVLRAMDPAALAVLTRGGTAELTHLFPALAPGGARERAPSRENPAEIKARLLWNFAQFLARFAAKQPLLLVLENLQWADASSLELLHFVARQVAGTRLVLVCTFNDAERDTNPTLRSTEQSLLSLGAARLHRLAPLSREDVDALVQQVLGGARTETRELSALLYGWTRGNPFFVEEVLKSLGETGRLPERDSAWPEWNLDALELPRSIRDAVVARIERLSPEARSLAEVAAVVGTRVTYPALCRIGGLREEDLLLALDALRRHRILAEGLQGDVVAYDFVHPLVRDVVYGELGLARARLLHTSVAESLERLHGADALRHADELAFHFARADARLTAPKAVRYLLLAGREALAKYANREAANYLQAALEHLDAAEGAVGAEEAGALVAELAQVRQRLGEHAAAMALWQRAREMALASGDAARLAGIERRIGLSLYWTGRFGEALARYDAGLAAAATAGDDALLARLRLSKGMCLQALGRPAEAQAEVHGALSIAERLDEAALLARVHRALLLLHVWTGPPDVAREHGERAVALAERAGQQSLAWSAHWAMAVLAGLTSNTAAVQQHLAAAERLAEELRSPLLRLWTAELSIEYASVTGDWDTGLALGERSIALARSLGQRTLLPRLLVWTGLILIGRGESERARALVDEAWELSGAGSGAGSGVDRPLDVHTVVPAHTGLTSCLVAAGEYRKAIAIGEAGLRIADRTGYVAWAIYRLLPMITEAALWLQDFEVAARYGARLRRDSERLGHTLGIAWADCCDALVAMLRKEHARALVLLRGAAESLEAIPFTYDAARVRRKLAWVLSQLGERDAAVRELHRAYDVFARLGAEQELSITRGMLRDLGGRPPARPVAVGAGGLTGREIGIVRLVASHKSNREIGAALGISPRTVSTHLSNIFAKLGVGSRAELADLAVRQGLTAR